MARSGLWRVEDFDLHKELYRGKTSLLYMATDKKSGIQVALKLYRKRKLSTLNRYQVEREIRIHIQLDHVNIIKLFAAFEDEKNVYMVQEFAGGGDLFEDLKKNGGQIKEKYAVRDVIVPFLNALQYLHGMGIIHRDIKPENILLTSHKVIKIADFGLSINVTQERPVTRAGTLDYMAPEVLICPDKRRPEENKDKVLLAYTAQVDAWAVGILAYELMVGYPPFEQESRAATYEHIMYKEPKFPAWMTEEARKFIAAALCKNATQRPTISQLAREGWILQYAKPVERPAGHSELEVQRSAASLAASPAMMSRPAGLVTSPSNLGRPLLDVSMESQGSGYKAGIVSPTSAAKAAAAAGQDQYNLSLSDPTFRSPHTPSSLGKRELKTSVSGGGSKQGSVTSLVMDEDASYSPLNDSHAHGEGLLSPLGYGSNQKRPSSHLKSRLGTPAAQAQQLLSGKVQALATQVSRVQVGSSSGADPSAVERSGGSYYRPQSGILSDDALLPRANSMTGGALSPLQASLYQQVGRSNSGALGTSRLGAERPTPNSQLEEEEDASSASKGNSKYAKLFAKMWGGKSSAAADADAFRVQASNGSQSAGMMPSPPSFSKASYSTGGGRKPGHPLKNLQEELLLSREASMVVTGREESVAGAPAMRFKQVDAGKLQALRAANASENSKGSMQHHHLAHMESSSALQRINSEAVMLRPGMDKNLGRSFTTASSPTMRKLANAPMVAKIAEYVAQNAGSAPNSSA